MATEFFIPKLGQTVEQVTLVKWLVPDGAKVTQGQEVLEVETDKAVFPVEANGKGYFHIGPFKEGDTVPVLMVVALIGKEEETFVTPGEIVNGKTKEEPEPGLQAQVANPSGNEVKFVAGQSEVFASPRARKMAREKNIDVSLIAPTGGGGLRVTERDVVTYLSQLPKITPVAQRMATSEGVDLRSVSGTGPGGKITKEDVARSIQTGAVSGAVIPSQSSMSLPVADIVERIPLKGVRSIIAERMSMSVHTTARVTLMMEVDATELVTIRERLKLKVAETWGFAPGYNDILAIVVAQALRKYTYMNARLAPDAIELMSHINIGLAVDTERGLLVPVIKDVDQKGMKQFGSEFRQLVDRARNNRSLPDDLSGGTFTITNLGMYDIDGFTPVINLPECAILGVGRIAPKPVVLNNTMVIRQMWTLSLVFDHRLVDGAPAARFLQYIKELIEEPYLLLAA